MRIERALLRVLVVIVQGVLVNEYGLAGLVGVILAWVWALGMDYFEQRSIRKSTR